MSTSSSEKGREISISGFRREAAGTALFWIITQREVVIFLTTTHCLLIQKSKVLKEVQVL